MEEEYHFTAGIYDTICKFIREKTRECSRKPGSYGIGIYSDKLCEEKLMTHPLKNVEQRKKIALGLDGVDFVFEVDDLENIAESARQAYEKYKEKKEEIKRLKQYKVGFIIGSFDMFHSGHLENIEIASQYCDTLYIVLKTDERIKNNKNKVPKQSTAERAAILKLLKPVKNVLYMDLDTTRQDVIEDVVRAYGEDIEPKDIVAIFGSDLKQKESEHIDEWQGITIVFTERDSKKMETVSSSHYQEEVAQHGGIHRYEDIEEEKFRE